MIFLIVLLFSFSKLLSKFGNFSSFSFFATASVDLCWFSSEFYQFCSIVLGVGDFVSVKLLSDCLCDNHNPNLL